MQPPHGYGPPGYGPPGHGTQGHGPPGYGPPGYGPPQGYGPRAYGPGFQPPVKKKGLGAGAWIALGALVLGFGGCIGLIVIASKPETPEQKAEREKTEKEALDARAAYVATLAKIDEKVRGLDPDSMSAKTCDGAKMKSNMGKDAHGIHVAYAPFLERFSKPESTWTKDESPWAWVTDNSWAGFFDSPPKADQTYGTASDAKTLQNSWLPKRYMVVVVPRRGENALPKVPRSGDFESGYFAGWAVIFDQTDASIACQFPLEVENSNKVGFRDSGAFKESPEKAILADFQDNFENALEKGVPSQVGLATGYGKILK